MALFLIVVLFLIFTIAVTADRIRIYEKKDKGNIVNRFD